MNWDNAQMRIREALAWEYSVPKLLSAYVACLETRRISSRKRTIQMGGRASESNEQVGAGVSHGSADSLTDIPEADGSVKSCVR
jgi:hypothetical protein